MDEVKTMARAGENVGKAVGTGMRGARHSARRASDVGIAMSKQAAAVADHELAQRGVSTTELQDQLARRTTGMSRKELAKLSRKRRKQWGKRTAQQRKQLARNAHTARKELAARIDPAARKHRKWPWFVVTTAALVSIAGVALMLTKRPEEIPLGSADDEYPDSDIQRREQAGTPQSTPSSAETPDKS